MKSFCYSDLKFGAKSSISLALASWKLRMLWWWCWSFAPPRDKSPTYSGVASTRWESADTGSTRNSSHREWSQWSGQSQLRWSRGDCQTENNVLLSFTWCWTVAEWASCAPCTRVSPTTIIPHHPQASVTEKSTPPVAALHFSLSRIKILVINCDRPSVCATYTQGSVCKWCICCMPVNVANYLLSCDCWL